MEADPEDGPLGPRHVVGLEYYYNAATVLESDRWMRACLQEHGEWESIDPDSPEAHRARLESSQRELRNLSDEIDGRRRRRR